MPRRALVSVSDKEGLVPFAMGLIDAGIEIISTGGTQKFLEKAGIPVAGVSEVTGFPEILDGRVKTLHPAIHGGLLAITDDERHAAQLGNLGIKPIDIVAVNLYPFAETVAAPGSSYNEAVENIDIGGPGMLRSAAKNHRRVTVVVDPADYGTVLEILNSPDEAALSLLRQRLAAKVFRHTAAYDAAIARYFTEAAAEEDPETLTLTYKLGQRLRYGENPHQKASFYCDGSTTVLNATIAAAAQIQGKELSYNNINDANAALETVKEFSEPAAVAVKHMNPCGVGIGTTALQAYTRAYAADPTSIFGGIVAVNREVDAAAAEKMILLFLEVIIAPEFSEAARRILSAKKNIRLLKVPLPMPAQDHAPTTGTGKKLVSVQGGLLIQDEDCLIFNDSEVTVPTRRRPSGKEWAALKFSWKVAKHVKSNAIVLAADETMTVGIGAGQANRVGAAAIAIEHAGKNAQGAVMASDAFFPYPDTVAAAAKAGVTAIIQPGGSIRDGESVAEADKYGIAMAFTGMRHFKH